MFFACSGLNVANPPMQLDIVRWKSTTCFASLFFYIQQPQLQKKSAYQFRVLGGKSEEVFVSIGSPLAAKIVSELSKLRKLWAQ